MINISICNIGIVVNYRKIYNSIIDRAKNRPCPEGYTEKHHIKPRCIGGLDTSDNIAVLTPEEHFLCHVLLVKMYPSDTQLIYAVMNMCIGHKGKRKSRRLYGWLRRKYSEVRKIDSMGDGNTQYGTMWINENGTTNNKKIKNNESIPYGWSKGRVLKKKPLCIYCETRNQTPKTTSCKDLERIRLYRLDRDKKIRTETIIS